jgi:hypothetical protein
MVILLTCRKRPGIIAAPGKYGLFNWLLLLLLLLSIPTLGNNNHPPISIKGKILGNGGEALAGVSVQVKGTSTGTASDLNGSYSITVPDAQSILVFSIVGYITQEVPVEGRSEINVTLEGDQKQLGEVVVTALGVKRRTKALTYAVQTVGTDQVNEAKTTNVITALQGKVAGMRITMSPNGPGSSATVNIRGARSLSGNNQPLYIIDGVPLDNSSRTNAVGGSTGVYGGRDGGDGIGMLNPDDIESMTVLKGPFMVARDKTVRS